MRRGSSTNPVDSAIRFITPSIGDTYAEPVPSSQRADFARSPMRPTL